jgi:hypothetical protein
MLDWPQVVLFGSIGGQWREQYIIPALEALQVTYYNPNKGQDWTTALGDQEAEVMAHCETIVMVINDSSPAFGGLVETGWAALGAAQRGQHFILQIDLDYQYQMSAALRNNAEGVELEKYLNHATQASRHLVYKHAQQFNLKTLYVVDSITAVIAKLNHIYDHRHHTN